MSLSTMRSDGQPRAHLARRRDVHDGVGVVQHPLDPVLGHDHGDGEVVHEPGDGGEHLLGAGGVEGRGRLVEQDDARVRGEHRPMATRCCWPPDSSRSGTSRSSAMPSRSSVSSTRLRIVAGGRPELLHAVGELLLDGVGDEAGERVLADDADEVGEVAGPVVAGVAAVQAHVAGQRAAGEVRDPPAHGAEQGRLARPGASDDEGQLALVDRPGRRRAAPAGRSPAGSPTPATARSRVSHGRAPPRGRRAAGPARPAAAAPG